MDHADINPIALEKLNTLKGVFSAAAKGYLSDAIADIVNNLTNSDTNEDVKSITGLGRRADGVHMLKCLKMIFDIKAENSEKSLRGIFLTLVGKENKTAITYKNYATKMDEVLKLL
jgi:hypothetical protein